MSAQVYSFQQDTPEVPHNFEVESALLGAILLNNEAYSRVASFLKPGHFYDPVHARLYDLCAQRIASGQIADARTMKSYVRINEDLGGISAGAYISKLALEATTIINAEDYGRMIFDLSVRRSLVTVAEEAAKTAREAPPDASSGALIEHIEGEFASLRDQHQVKGFSLSLGDDLRFALDSAVAAYQRNEPAGWEFFLPDIESTIDMRLVPGRLYGLIGASGDGKTTFTLQQLRFGAERLDKNGNPDPLPGLFLSGEQSKTECIWQMHVQHLSRLAERGEVQWRAEAKDIADGKLTEEEFDLMVEDAQHLQKLPLAIQEWSDLRIAEIGVRVRAFVKRRGPGIVAIDHAKKIVSDYKTDNLAQQVFQVGEGLKNLAKETGCAIILLMHRNSDFLDRRVMRPVRADVFGKENGLQNLDACIALYRAERWLREKMHLTESTKEIDRLSKMIEGDPLKGESGEHGKADFFALKARFGKEGGSRKVRFIAPYTRFESFERRPRPQSELPI